MTDFKTDTLDTDRMILDPNNFRFQDAPDFVFADPKRFAEETVQAKAAARLRDEGLLPLKQSILRNGFLPFERLVVTAYDEDRFLVIEGNRRLAAMRWIRSDQLAGAPVPKEIAEALKEIPVVIVPPNPADPALLESLMGVRTYQVSKDGVVIKELFWWLRKKRNSLLKVTKWRSALR